MEKDILQYCPLNFKTMSNYNVQKLENQLLHKLKKDLFDKYNRLIYEKQYDINLFDTKLKNEIKKYNYVNYSNYTKLLYLVQQIFLNEISKYDDVKRKNFLTKQKLRKITNNPNFYFTTQNKLMNKQKPYKSNVYIPQKERYLWNLKQREFEIEAQKRIEKTEKNIIEQNKKLIEEKNKLKKEIEEKINKEYIN